MVMGFTVRVFANLPLRELEKLLIVVFVIKKPTKKERLYVDHRAENSFAEDHARQSGGMLNFQWKSTRIGKTAIVLTVVSWVGMPKRFVDDAVPKIFGF